MRAFHELVLASFLDYMGELQEINSDFNEIYFDKKCHAYIEQAVQEEAKESSDDDAEELNKELYYDVSCYSDLLFTDLDYTMLDNLYNARRAGNTSYEEYLGINLDFYFELLPLDIQEKYKTEHITLTGEIVAMLRYIGERAQYGNLYKLFWENDKPVNEGRIQLILENIMDAYFYNQEVDITREAQLGSGKVDFKLYRSSQPDEKILIEIKRASSTYLKKGYEKQLIDYMRSSKYKNAFYLIACFTDEEYEDCERFIRENVYTDEFQLYINIAILNFRKRKTASRY